MLVPFVSFSYLKSHPSSVSLFHLKTPNARLFLVIINSPKTPTFFFYLSLPYYFVSKFKHSYVLVTLVHPTCSSRISWTLFFLLLSSAPHFLISKFKLFIFFVALLDHIFLSQNLNPLVFKVFIFNLIKTIWFDVTK